VEEPLGESLAIEYDADGDILHLFAVEPYPEQESDEIGEGVIARMNPATGQVEGIEVLFFSSRFVVPGQQLRLPVKADIRVRGED
jgi:uncharacterized protein YuzE